MVLKTDGFACTPRIELRSKECIDTVLKPLIDHVNLPINGSLTSKDIFHTVISMAVDKNSIHSISKRYQKVPCETSIRHHLKKLDMSELTQSNEKILMQMPIGNLKPGKKYEFAIDYTNDPYYGKVDTSNDKYVIRGQAKKSTNSFYSYVSLYIINKNERFTIAILPVEKGKSNVATAHPIAAELRGMTCRRFAVSFSFKIQKFHLLATFLLLNSQITCMF